jgi:hypothetical protein
MCKENSEMVGTRCHMSGLYMHSRKLECSLYVPSTNRCHHRRICALGGWKVAQLDTLLLCEGCEGRRSSKYVHLETLAWSDSQLLVVAD